MAGPTVAAGFTALGVPGALTAVLARSGISEPFPIQTATLPDSLAGRDVLGRGRTGSGKTYAFVLPLVARLSGGKPSRAGHPRALILAPTRELASQIEAAMAPLASAVSLRTMTIFGGVGAGPQIAKLRSGVDVVVACPGRLADHISGGHVSLDAVEVTVLDEADHMADLGFLPIVRRLMDQTPKAGQRMLFSATLDGGIDTLVDRFLTDPVTHSVDSAESPVASMAHHVLHIAEVDRLPVLVDLAAAPGRTLVFTRTKQRAKRLTRDLIASGVPAVELHGNLGQSARTRNLQAFTNGSARTLVATDIAARGIHVDDVTLVVHADPPVEHKAYLHRSGRTARAGAAGIVVTLMTDGQVADVRDLTRKAAIKPTTTRLGPGDPLLAKLAPGPRSFQAPPPPAPLQQAGARGEARQRGGARRGSSATGTAQKPATRSGAHRSAATRSGGASNAGHAGGGSGAQRAVTTVPRPSRGHRSAAGTTSPAAPGGVPTEDRGATGTARTGTTGAAAFSAAARPRSRRRSG